MSARLAHIDQHVELDKPRDLLTRIDAEIAKQQAIINETNAQLAAISNRVADPEEVLRGTLPGTRDALIEATRPHYARIEELRQAQRQSAAQFETAKSRVAVKVLATELAPAMRLHKALAERLADLRQTNDAMHGELARLERMGLFSTPLHALAFTSDGCHATQELITAAEKQMRIEASDAERFVSTHNPRA